MDDVKKAATELLRHVNAHLDYEDDEDMSAAAEALTESMAATGRVDPALARALLDECDATLDYEEDEEMGEAVEALRDLLPDAPAP